MKHLREDYNQRIQDNANLIPQDEPVFLLRGKDIFTPGLMLDWAKQLRLAGGDPALARLVEDGAQEMIVWQRANPDKMMKKGRLRLPDMPKEREVIKLLSEPYGYKNPDDLNMDLVGIDVLVKEDEKEIETKMEFYTMAEAEAIQPGYKFFR